MAVIFLTKFVKKDALFCGSSARSRRQNIRPVEVMKIAAKCIHRTSNLTEQRGFMNPWCSLRRHLYLTFFNHFWCHSPSPKIFCPILSLAWQPVDIAETEQPNGRSEFFGPGDLCEDKAADHSATTNADQIDRVGNHNKLKP